MTLNDPEPPDLGKKSIGQLWAMARPILAHLRLGQASAIGGFVVGVLVAAFFLGRWVGGLENPGSVAALVAEEQAAGEAEPRRDADGLAANVDAGHATGSGHGSARRTDATPSKVLELRRVRGLEPLRPTENQLELPDIPPGRFGFTCRLMVYHHPDEVNAGAIYVEASPYCLLEIHKIGRDQAEVIFFVSPTDASSIQAGRLELNFVLSHRSLPASSHVESPVDMAG